MSKKTIKIVHAQNQNLNPKLNSNSNESAKKIGLNQISYLKESVYCAIASKK